MTPKNPTPERIAHKLNELSADVRDAVANYVTVREMVSRPWETPIRVTEDLCTYYADVAFRRREADPEVERQLSLDFLKRLKDEGLILQPLDHRRPAAGLRIVDPQLKVLVAAAEAEAHRRTAIRDSYATENAALLTAHADAQQMKGIKTALEGSDPAALREALDQLPASTPKTSNTLTTHDLEEAALK